MKKGLNRSGQSTLEYVIVLTAIVAAILIAASALVKPSLNKLYIDVSNTLNATGDRVANTVAANFSP